MENTSWNLGTSMFHREPSSPEEDLASFLTSFLIKKRLRVMKCNAAYLFKISEMAADWGT